MANPEYAYLDGVASLTVTALADIKKLSVVRGEQGYAVFYDASPLLVDDLPLVLSYDTKKVRFDLKVGDLISTQAEIDLGLNIGQVDQQNPGASRDEAQTSWGALLKDQFHFAWVNGTPGNDVFDFNNSPDIASTTRSLMATYERGIWVDLKSGDDRVTGSAYGDNFNISGEGLRRIDGGLNDGAPPWGGRATDSVDVFISSSDTVHVEDTEDEGYTHKLWVNNEVRALLKGIETVNIQIWNDRDHNGERDWGSEVQWVRNIQLAIQVNEVRLDPNDPTRTDWGQKLEDMGHLAWINGTKGNDAIDAEALTNGSNAGLQFEYKHGVWVDGGEGDDTITGTDYSDNIKGGPGEDKVDGGAHIAPTGQRGQDVFEIDLLARNFEDAQALLKTVRISQSDLQGNEAGYPWMVEVGTPGDEGYQKDYLRNIEAVSVTVRDASNNWLTGQWVNTALNVGEIRLDPSDNSKTEWGTLLADQHHFAWVNGTSADEAFDYSGATEGVETVSDQTRSLMDEHDRGMWVDTGAGNDTIVTSPYSDSIIVSGVGTKWVDAGANLGKLPWGEKGRDEVDVFVPSENASKITQVVLLTKDSTGSDKTAFEKGYTYKVQVIQAPLMSDQASPMVVQEPTMVEQELPLAYLKNVERVNIQIWDDKNGDGQRQWHDPNNDPNNENEMIWVKQVPLAVQVNEIRVSASRNDETEWGQKLDEMYHMAWINGTDQSDSIDAPALLSDATQALQQRYARGIWIDAGAGDDQITATGFADNIRGGWGNDMVRGGLHSAPSGERGQDVFDIQLWADNEDDAKALLQRVKVLPSDQEGYDWMVISPVADDRDEVDYLQGIEVVNVYINDPAHNHWLAGRWQPIALHVGEIRIDRDDPTRTEWGSNLSEQYHYAWVSGTNVSETFDFHGGVEGAETVTAATRGLMNRDQRGLSVDMAGGNDQIITSPFGDNITISGDGVRWIDGGEQRGTDPWGNAPKDHLDVFVKGDKAAAAVRLQALDASTDQEALDKSYSAKVVLGDSVLAYLKNIEVVNVQIWDDLNGDELRQWDQDQFRWFARLTVDVNEVRVSPTNPTKTDWGTPLSEQWHFAWINGTEQGESIDAPGLVSAGTAGMQETYSRGLWINAGAGDDTITGTPYSDDIEGGPGNDRADGGGQTAPAGEQGRDTYQVRIEIDIPTSSSTPQEPSTVDPSAAANMALSRLRVSRVNTEDEAGFGYKWQIEYGNPGDSDHQVDYIRNFESLSVSVHDKNSGQWLGGYWKNLALTVGEVRLSKDDPSKTEWGGKLADQFHFAWVNGIDDDEVFDYNTHISAAAKTLMTDNERGLWVETRGGQDEITGSPFGDNFNIVVSDQGLQKIDGGDHDGTSPWGGAAADHLDLFVDSQAQADQVKIVALTASEAEDLGYSLKAIIVREDGSEERILAYLKNVERVNIQLWNDINNDDQRDWGSEVKHVQGYDLVVRMNYPNNRDALTGTVWANGTPSPDRIDVQALINTLPTDADPAKNWRGTRLEVNINADQGEGGDTIIGSNNPDMITPGMGVNYISGGAQVGNQSWNKFGATYDSLQLFSGHEGALWKFRKITELKPPLSTDQSPDAHAYREGYKFKVDMSDPEEQEVHYIQGVEQIAFKVREDLNGDGINDVFNLSFVNMETPDVSWTRGEKGSTTVPPANFFISGSDFIKEVDANALVDSFIQARQDYPVSPSDLPKDFQLSSIANESNSFGTFMMLGGGDHRVTGTDFTDVVLLDPSGNSTVDGGDDVGYWKYAGVATGAQDTLRLVDKVDVTAVLLPQKLVKMPAPGTSTKAFSSNMTPAVTTDDIKGATYTISESDLADEPAMALVKPKMGRTNLPDNVQELVTRVETAPDLAALNLALENLSEVADLHFGLFLGVADLNADGKFEYSSMAVLERGSDAEGQLVLAANTTATVNPVDDLLSPGRYNSSNYHLIKLSDWAGFGSQPLSALTDEDAQVLRDVYPKDASGQSAAATVADLRAIAAYAASEKITSTDFEYALVSYQYDYANEDFGAVAGVTLLKDVESLQIRLWMDGNFDFRPSGNETTANLGSFTLKPNAYIVKPEDLSASTTGGKPYAGSVSGTGMAETLDLKKDYQPMVPAAYQAQKLGFKVTDLSDADTVIGSDFDDFFALSAHDDQIDGGAGSDRVAFWWKPSSTAGAASLKTVQVPGTDNAEPYVKIVQTQNGLDTELARMTQTANGWSIEHIHKNFANGFGANTDFGKDVLTGVEELVVLLHSDLKDKNTGAILIDDTKGVTDTVPFVVKLSPTVDYPQGADASRTSVTFNGSMFADVIDAPALLRTLPSSPVARENWQGTTLSTNILLNGGGDRVIGTPNADIIVAAAGVNFIDGGANTGRTAWVPNWWTPLEKSYWGLEGATDQLQIFIRDTQDANNVTIESLASIPVGQRDATDTDALAQGYTTKVVYNDSENPQNLSVNYIKNIEYVGKRIWEDKNNNLRRDAGEVTNHAYTPVDDTIINWRAGDIGKQDVGAYYFDLTASQYVTTIHAPSLIDRFIANKKAYPVLAADKVTLDLPADYDLGKVIDYNSSYGVLLNAGAGSHQITGTAHNDMIVVAANGSNVIDGGAHEGYYKYPLNTATGTTLAARDVVRITEETTDLSTKFDSEKYSLIKVSDWVQSQAAAGQGGSPASVQDVLNNRALGSLESDWIKSDSVSAVLAAQLGENAANSTDFLLVKTSSSSADREVLGMDLLKNIERIEWRFWNDVNGDGRQGGGTAGFKGEISQTAARSLELKPNLTVLEANDQSYASTAGLPYMAVSNGTSFADTINLQSGLANLNAAPTENGMGVKFTDFGGNDAVTGSDGNDLFYLAGGDDVLDGGQGSSDRALVYWAPNTAQHNATLKVTQTDSAIVFQQTQNDVDVDVLKLNKTIGNDGASIWTVVPGNGSPIVGFNSTPSIGTDELTGFEQFIVAVNTGIDLTKVSLTGLQSESVTTGYLMVNLT